MWHLNSIQASNFMSFEKVHYDFENKCYIIKGINNDNDSQQSNGGGKTSFVDIFPIALFGYSLTGRNVKDCISWSSDSSSFTVKAILTNKATKQECLIERRIFSKKASELIILIDNEVPSSIPTKQGVKNGVDIKEGNKFILDHILDIKEEDLLNYFFISKTNYSPFLEVNTERKLEVISRFTNTAIVDKIIASLEADVKSNTSAVNSLSNKIFTADGYIEALQASLNADAMKVFEQQKVAQIKSYQDQIESYDQQLLESQDNIEVVNNEISELVFHETDLNEIKVLQSEWNVLQESYMEIVKLMKEITPEIQNAQNYLAGKITCPKCENEFHLSIKETYTQDELDTFLLDFQALEQELESIHTNQEDISSKIQDINDLVKQNKLTERRKTVLLQNISSFESQQERILKAIEDLESKIAETHALSFVDEKKNIQEQIKAKEKEIASIAAEITSLNTLIDQSSQWIKHFEEFKFYLGNKPIEVICSLVNNYLKMIGSDLNLHIEGFKRLKSGELRQSLNPIIYRNWINPQPYVQFSEGERVRLNLAVDLAFQQLINASSKTGGLNYYQSDEMISGLDSLGVTNTAKAFSKLNKAILLVTHSASDMNFENTISIEKNKGISSIRNS